MDASYTPINRVKQPTVTPLMQTGMAIMLLLVVAAIHLIEVPDNLQETAYKGVLFLCGAEMAFTAAVGIYHGARWWGWGLGFLVTSGAFTLYIISRTVGLPGLPVDHDWLEPIGILSLLVEASYITLFVVVALPNWRRFGTASAADS